MTELMKWADQELELAGYKKDDAVEGPNKWLRESVMELLKVFSDQGHSGSSAPFTIQAFTRLASWKPLTPLTGEDDEWRSTSRGSYQNKRFSEVFKDGDGQAYWFRGKVFWTWETNDNGEKYKSYFVNNHSRVDITFPFVVPDKPQYFQWDDETNSPMEGEE